MNAEFESAVQKKGPEYLAAEKKLLDDKTGQAKTVLSAGVKSQDPVARALARNLLAMREGTAPENEVALEVLDALDQRYAETPIGRPRAQTVDGTLKWKCGNKAAEFLALRLLKQPDWKQSRVAGVLAYIGESGDTNATDLLIRFANETPQKQSRETAITAIRKLGDRDLAQKIAAEQSRLEKERKALPPEILSLKESPR